MYNKSNWYLIAQGWIANPSLTKEDFQKYFIPKCLAENNIEMVMAKNTGHISFYCPYADTNLQASKSLVPLLKIARSNSMIANVMVLERLQNYAPL